MKLFTTFASFLTRCALIAVAMGLSRLEFAAPRSEQHFGPFSMAGEFFTELNKGLSMPGRVSATEAFYHVFIEMAK